MMTKTNIPPITSITNNPLRANMLNGTHPRRAQMFKEYGAWCTCDRCRDPTENGSYFSAIVCPNHSYPSSDPPSYLLPKNPLNPESDWSCTNSSCLGNFTSFQIH